MGEGGRIPGASWRGVRVLSTGTAVAERRLRTSYTTSIGSLYSILILFSGGSSGSRLPPTTAWACDRAVSDSDRALARAS